MSAPLPLPDVIAALERLAPLTLAEDWDNVGLLVEPLGARPVTRVLCTIDLTEAVLDEAAAAGAELIVAYHPPVFRGLKRLRASHPSERVVLRALHERVAVYSPHTALDSVAGGVNDWLAAALGQGIVAPLAASRDPTLAGSGLGRRVTLAAPAPLDALIERVKRHLGIAQVRVAAAARHRVGVAADAGALATPQPAAAAPVTTAAVCAGAGGAVLERAEGVELLLSGELRHHDILARVAGGTSVIVTDHSHSERGYLPTLAARLAEAAPGLEVVVSRADADPLVPC